MHFVPEEKNKPTNELNSEGLRCTVIVTVLTQFFSNAKAQKPIL